MKNRSFFMMLSINNWVSHFGSQEKNDNFRQSRDLLLPKLIAGEVDVSEMNIAIKEQENGD